MVGWLRNVYILVKYMYTYMYICIYIYIGLWVTSQYQTFEQTSNVETHFAGIQHERDEMSLYRKKFVNINIDDTVIISFPIHFK